MLTGCYQKNKGRLQKKAHERYQNLFEKETSISIVLNNIEIFLRGKRMAS